MLDPPPDSRRGLLLMLAATASLVMMTVAVKGLRDDLDTQQIIFWRSAPGLMWIGFQMWRAGITMRPTRPWPIVVRVVAGLASMAGYFWSLGQMSVTDNAVLHLLQPIVIAILAVWILGETTKRTTWISIGVGVIGAAIALRVWEESSAHGPALAVGLAAAVCAGLAQTSTRRATRSDPPSRIVCWHFVALTVASFGWCALSGGVVLPTADQVPLVALMVAGGTAGQILMTKAYQASRAAEVSAVGYASIPLAAAADWCRGTTPHAASVAGGLIMLVGAWMLTRVVPARVKR